MLFKIEKLSEILTKNGILMAKCTAIVPGNPMSVYSFNVDGILIDTGARSLVNEFKPYFEQADYDAIYLTHFGVDFVTFFLVKIWLFFIFFVSKSRCVIV